VRLGPKVGAVDAVAGKRRERDVDRLSESGEPEDVIESALEAGSSTAAGEVERAEIDVEVAEVVSALPSDGSWLGRGDIGLLNGSLEPAAEVGLPFDFGHVVGKPLSPPGDGGLEIRDAKDVPLRGIEASFAAHEVRRLRGTLIEKLTEMALMGMDLPSGGVEGLVVGSSEEAPLGEVLEACLGGSKALAGGGDGPVGPVKFASLDSRDAFQDGELGAELLETAQFRAPVWTGAGVDEVPGDAERRGPRSRRARFGASGWRRSPPTSASSLRRGSRWARGIGGGRGRW
jgi:hypothetical protein